MSDIARFTGKFRAQSIASRSGPTVNSGDHSTIESRLTHLESLLNALMRNKELPSEHEVVPPDLSRCSVDAATIQSQGDSVDDTAYVGSTHWSAILDDIHELQVALSGSIDSQGVNKLATPGAPTLGTELIFGLPHIYSLQQVISRYLPSKLDIDRYLSWYFQGETFVIPFIHTYHFQRQYREFWADPTKVDPLWLSILFSICCLSSLTRETAGPGRPLQRDALPESPKFHTAAGQCLVIGEYHRPQRLAIEALAVYAQCKNLTTLDPSREAGMILGMVVRMAYELGYHRDPDSFGSLSVFEGEMRRRFWAACKHMDIMISFQQGLPSNICLESCDTKSPRNLLDSDFDVDTQVLPESRPETEPTKLLWFIVKDRQITSFSKVCKYMLSFKEQSEADLHRLDEEIRQTYATIPDILRTRPLSESIADPPFLIITRLYIEFICLKNLCVLHRGYMVQGNVNSTKACVEAAKRLVSQFINILTSAKTSRAPELQPANDATSGTNSALLATQTESTIGQTSFAPFDVFDPFNIMGMDFEIIDWDAFDPQLSI
ncbi:hypothetical protein AFLA_001272 [Aspergillus flavus NRRL3357]|nr:hypothetical protein AFLA_001272 [Aspergillus flavus NRRL3357]